MSTKEAPTITHEEVIVCAANYLRDEINDLRSHITNPPSVTETLEKVIERGASELEEKLKLIETLYKLETGMELPSVVTGKKRT